MDEFYDPLVRLFRVFRALTSREEGDMFELKPLSREAIPRALEKAERYRLLNEPAEAESICLRRPAASTRTTSRRS